MSSILQITDYGLCVDTKCGEIMLKHNHKVKLRRMNWMLCAGFRTEVAG
jgi:hypothetical protein